MSQQIIPNFSVSSASNTIAFISNTLFVSEFTKFQNNITAAQQLLFSSHFKTSTSTIAKQMQFLQIHCRLIHSLFMG